ncbi:MAG: hypothetical protein AUH25_02415 [Thaumarchaeota archaeon 13_1_40CM_38_12]|nr:MAG: hypothetical protein AUH25_02415 [Thaumarchaeota archaeon 13_1_40CM_38_12]OLC37056.1 MAG: hypothetical protein AUH84_00140 [Thaumarchaeota archaeon 13_1_40CM_4_38_7]OLC94419.1 MAG: hypothetical protein AUI92_00895 [Thaumarchaeota archaeon 13_1_40CM_3_38_6]OLD28546.1 MAG: hypothetical protein AUI62_04175 [Thaumarchaeota archaeon 13_1_40CM_2_39_7]OLE40107.1 MAG: hypothetical protein AUF74_00860 [Thaumarchaeota archaeon 13_1_20CM_2_38_5]TLY04928.1 MAG: hypothetical protein E6K87_01965 [Ni
MFDSSKHVFVSGSCFSDKVITKYIQNFLERNKFPRENIFEGLDLGIALTGDYLIRCNGGLITIFEIEIKSNNNFVTKRIAEL